MPRSTPSGRWRRNRVLQHAACCVLMLAAFGAFAEELFTYRAESGDTLIGIGKRLLASPSQWEGVQRLNRIRNPRRIPVGTEIRIPLEWMRRERESARIIAVRGRAESDGQPVEAGRLLAEGSTVSTAEDGYVTIVLPDTSEFTLESDSQLRLVTLRRLGDTDAREISLSLERGRVETRAVRRTSGAAGRFEIRSRVAAAAVRGTEFRFAAENDAARSEVLAGKVALQGTATASEVQLSSGFGSFVRGSSPPAEPRRLLPAPDVTHLPARQDRTLVRFDLAGLAGAQAWRGQIATDREFREVLAETLSDTPALRFSNLDDGNYWLRVRGIDGERLEGLDAYHPFELRARPEPPFLGTPVADAKLPVGAVVFSWSQPAGAARYRMQVATDATFSSPVRDEEGIVGSTHTVEALEPGAYWWRMQSIRADGHRGPFGDPQAFTLMPLPADPNPAALEENELRFSWPARPGQTFLFQLSRDPDFARIEIERTLVEPHVALKRPVGGTYYMRVRASDPDGYVGPFTTTQRVDVPARTTRPWWLLFLLLLPVL